MPGQSTILHGHHANPRAEDLMRRTACVIGPKASVTSAAALMRDADVGCLVVVDGARLVGVITDRDLVLRCLAPARPAQECTVGEIMSRDVLRCHATASVGSAAAAMGDYQVRRLPVCDARNRLVGLLTLDSIAEHFSEHLAGETLGEIVETR